MKRMRYFIVFFVFFVIEIIIAIYVHDAFVRPYVGDILVVIVLYCMLRVIFPRKLNRLPIGIFLFATFVECLQYFNFVHVIGMESNTFFRIMLGSTFDVKDIICYGVGCILLGLYDKYYSKMDRE